MVLKEIEGDKCPWDYERDEGERPVVSFALCHDCPFMVNLLLYGKVSNGEKTDKVEVTCQKE